VTGTRRQKNGTFSRKRNKAKLTVATEKKRLHLGLTGRRGVARPVPVCKTKYGKLILKLTRQRRARKGKSRSLSGYRVVSLVPS